MKNKIRISIAFLFLTSFCMAEEKPLWDEALPADFIVSTINDKGCKLTLVVSSPAWKEYVAAASLVGDGYSIPLDTKGKKMVEGDGKCIELELSNPVFAAAKLELLLVPVKAPEEKDGKKYSHRTLTLSLEGFLKSE